MFDLSSLSSARIFRRYMSKSGHHSELPQVMPLLRRYASRPTERTLESASMVVLRDRWSKAHLTLQVAAQPQEFDMPRTPKPRCTPVLWEPLSSLPRSNGR